MNIRYVLLSVLLIVMFTACEDDTPRLDLTELLEHIKIGEPINYKNLTVVPLYSDIIQKKVDYVTLQQALENKWIEIREIEDGRVPKVLINNMSNKRIYIMSGEIITGCKQDRIIARDLIIEPSVKNIDLDVFCVEAGRWTRESENFFSKKNLGTAKLRERAQRKDGIAQLEIWNEIAKLSRSNNVVSATNAYQDIYEEEEIKITLDDFEAALKEKLDKKAVGVIIAVGDKIVSVDIFKNNNMLQSYWPELIKSSALYTVDEQAAGSISLQKAEVLLRNLHEKKYIKNKNREDKTCTYTYVDDELNISAHMYDGVLIHLAGFPVDEDAKTRKDRQEFGFEQQD
jgi:hypothetical protein